jgi:hypothetical protein
MKKLLSAAILIILIISGISFSASKKLSSTDKLPEDTVYLNDTSSFTLRKGDILVRPNWEWLPGSCQVINGRRYGHVAMVTEDATGKTIDEALAKASVIEALFFDQNTRKFQLHKKDQIRERNARISFGPRFKGIRYRLRLDLTDEQREKMVGFLRSQLDGGYNIFSGKIKYSTESEKNMGLAALKNHNWHCATLIWEACYLVTGTDIDGNGGLFIYPSDIIISKCFTSPYGRVLF